MLIQNPCSSEKSAVAFDFSRSTLEVNGKGIEISLPRPAAGWTGLIVITGQKKSPSDGQGRVAHRRGSRFYTTILRVVNHQNTGFSRKFRDAEKCFWILTIPRLNLPTDSGSMLMPSQPRYGVGESALARKSKSLGNCEIDPDPRGGDTDSQDATCRVAKIEHQIKRSQASEIGDCSGGESAWLRCRPPAITAANWRETFYRTRMFIERNAIGNEVRRQPGATQGTTHARPPMSFKLNSKRKAPTM